MYYKRIKSTSENPLNPMKLCKSLYVSLFKKMFIVHSTRFSIHQDWRDGDDGGGDGDQLVEETPSSAVDPSVAPMAEAPQLIRIKEVRRRRADMGWIDCLIDRLISIWFLLQESDGGVVDADLSSPSPSASSKEVAKKETKELMGYEIEARKGEICQGRAYTRDRRS